MKKPDVNEAILHQADVTDASDRRIVPGEDGATAAGDMGGLWRELDRLIAGSPSTGALIVHGVGQLAAARLRRIGEPVPPELAMMERATHAASLAAPFVLRRARDAFGGLMMVLKGPEVAMRYPMQARGFGDIDLLVDDAPAAQRALVEAGFTEVNDPELYIDIHHLRPLVWPTLPLKVEIHMRPKWPGGLTAPPMLDIREAAVQSSLEVDGLLAPRPDHHALILAAHGWAHVPLRALRDLVDVAVMKDGLDEDELRRLARSWDLTQVWETTCAAIDDVLLRDRRTLAASIWARHLRAGRERTVLESHLEHWLSPFWGLPVQQAAKATLTAVANELRPAADETWRQKGVRVRQALGRAFVSRSEHDRLLGDVAARRRRRPK